MLLQDIINLSNKVSNDFKTVDYFGLTLNVPIKTTVIATDKNGMVAFYSEMPEMDEVNWVSDSEVALGGFLLSDQHVVDDWKDSLVLIEYQ